MMDMDLAALQKAAREKLAGFTPLRRDCGTLCAGACCRPDEAGRGGMALYPGEASLYQRLPDGFSIHRDVPGAPHGLLVCGGSCSREDRPLACRLFPLMPTPSGGVALDPRAWPL